MLTQGIKSLTEKCINGITVNKEICKEQVNNSIGIITALNPYIGYENATRIAKQAIEKNESVRDIVLAEKLLSKKEIDDILSPENMTKPR